MKFNCILLVLALSSQLLFSQQKVVLSNAVKDNIINFNTGMLLVRTSKNLYGINPETKKVQWTNGLSKVNFDSYIEIPFTPLAVFESKPILNSKLLSNTINTKGKSRTILNVTNGDVLFNSEEVGFKAVYNTLLMPEKKAVLVDGLKDKELVVALYSYQNKALLWENNLANTTFFKNIKSTLFHKEITLADKKQDVFWLKNNSVFKINGKSGKVEFQKENVQSIAINKSKDVVCFFTPLNYEEKLKRETSVMAYTTNDMKPLWKDPVVLRGSFKDVAFDNKKMIVTTSRGFNIINPDGNTHWKRMEQLPLIKRIVPVDEGYLVVQEKFLVLINKRGRKAWEKPLKIALDNNENPIYILEDEQSAIYISQSKANKFTIANGDKKWEEIVLNDASYFERNLKLKQNSNRVWYDSIQKQYPVYNNNNFYILSNAKNTTPKSIYTFDFEKSIPNLSITKSGYFLENKNHFFLFDTTGNLLYKKEYAYDENSSLLNESFYYVKRGFGTYKAARSFIFTQAIEGVNSTIASGNLGFITNVSSGIYGSFLLFQNPTDIISNLDDIGLSSGLESVFNRIQKGKNHEESILVVVPKEDKSLDVLRLYIPSGKDEHLKYLGEDQKKFVIDQVEDILYSFKKKVVTIEQL